MHSTVHPSKKSRFMQNSVTRVRGSAGLKFPSEFSVKAQHVIDTDSSATARVEVDDTVNREGRNAGSGRRQPQRTRLTKLAQKIETKHLRTAKARIFIGSFLKIQPSNWRLSEAKDSNGKAGGGATGPCTLVQANIAC